MGTGASKPKIDLSTAQFTAAELTRQVTEQAAQAADTASKGAWGTAKWIIGVLIFIGISGGRINIFFLTSKARCVKQSFSERIQRHILSALHRALGNDISGRFT